MSKHSITLYFEVNDDMLEKSLFKGDLERMLEYIQDQLVDFYCEETTPGIAELVNASFE